MPQKEEVEKPPLFSKIPIEDFESAHDMEQGLLAYELLVARRPNHSNLGFTHHVALVYKDGDGCVYSCAMLPHSGVLKQTKENADVIQKQSTGRAPEAERTGSVRQVPERESEGGSGHSEPTGESGERDDYWSDYIQPIKPEDKAQAFRNRK